METPQLKLTYWSSRPVVQHVVFFEFLDDKFKVVKDIGKATYIHMDDDKHFIPITQLIDIHKTQPHEYPTRGESNYIVERFLRNKTHVAVDSFLLHGNTIEYKRGEDTGYIFNIEFISAEALTYRI